MIATPNHQSRANRSLAAAQRQPRAQAVESPLIASASAAMASSHSARFRPAIHRLIRKRARVNALMQTPPSRVGWPLSSLVEEPSAPPL